MKLIRVAAAALNQTPLDWDGNLANILAAIDAARQRGAAALSLPELCITGYGCEDAFFSSAVQRMALRVLSHIVPESRGLAISVGLPVLHAGALYNACAMAVDGELVGFTAKQRLAGDGLHYEPRWFKPWPADAIGALRIEGSTYPIGDLMFDLGGIRLGMEICEDAWVADRPAAGHSRLAADIIFNPSASHFAFGKAAIRERLVCEASRAYGVTYVYSNLLGNEAGRVIYDGQTLIATHGELVARGARLGYQRADVCDAVVDVDATRTRRMQSSSYEPHVTPDERSVIAVAFDVPVAKPEAEKDHAQPWERSEHLVDEEFTRAIALGLFDYMRKSRSRGFVVSLSGGADSAAVTCLVAMMVRMASAELGPEAFCQASGLPCEAEQSAAALTRRLLATVYQATRNSGEATRNSARQVAEAVAATHYELDVDALVTGYIERIEAALGRKLTWQQDDLVLQNIQARARGPSAWLLANERGALLLATSNRSEAAVGYATMDGDTCGGISPIGGIDKAFLRRWLRWLEQTGPADLGPIPALRVVNELQPTAELRPKSEGQTDEDDLMPYDLLDAIEDQAIGEKRSPEEVLAAVQVQFSQYSRAQLLVWVRRFFELWSRNQWKRERYAPAFHVDDKNLDPKTWCRFPILSGGFRRELEELRG